MKRILTIFICILSFMLVSCGSEKSTSLKAIEDGKTALINEEYEKAEELFEKAVNEDKGNTVAKDLLDLSKEYIDLLKIIKDDNYDKLDNVLSDLEANDELDIIRESYEKTKKEALEKKEAFIKEKDKSNKKTNKTNTTEVEKEDSESNKTNNKDKVSKEESSKNNKQQSKEQSNKKNAKLSAEQAVETARQHWKRDNTEGLKEVVFNEDPILDENNEYVIGVCSAHGEYKSIGIYYVNSSTGNARFVKD